MNNSWTSKSWEQYYIAPGAGRKLYVLRRRGQNYWLDQHYNERFNDFDHKIQTLGKNLDECRVKANNIVGKDNYIVEEAELGLITQTKDERRHFKFPNGRLQGKDINEIDLSDDTITNYIFWWWSEYNYDVDKGLYNGKSYQKFHKNLETFMVDNDMLIEHDDTLMTKKDYEYKLKKEAWKAESKRQSKASEFVGSIKERIESEVRMVFSIKVAETAYGDFVITKYVDRNDNTIMIKGSYPRMDDKENFHKVKFTIKEHTEYKGEKQNIVQRMTDYGEVN